MVQDHDDAARLDHPAHLAQHRNRVRHRADGVGRHRRVELAVAEVHHGGVHGLERDIVQPEFHHLVLRFLEHLLGKIDAGDAAVGGVQGQVQARADADLEDLLATLDVQEPDGLLPAGMKDPVEDEIIGGGVDLVGSLDLPLFQRRVHRKSPPAGFSR